MAKTHEQKVLQEIMLAFCNHLMHNTDMVENAVMLPIENHLGHQIIIDVTKSGKGYWILREGKKHCEVTDDNLGEKMLEIMQNQLDAKNELYAMRSSHKKELATER